MIVLRPRRPPALAPTVGVAAVLPGAGLPPELLHNHDTGDAPGDLLAGILRLPDALLPPASSEGGDLLLAELEAALSRPLEAE